MNINFNENSKTFKIDTNNTSYVIKVIKGNFLTHLYYGARLNDHNLDYVLYNIKRSLTTNPIEAQGVKGFSLDMFPMEYPAYGTGDFRSSALMIQLENGSTATDLRYISHEIYKGKPRIAGLPATFGKGDYVEGLKINCEDPVSKVLVELYYHVFKAEDVITRHCIIKNTTNETIKIKRAMSMSMDFLRNDFDMIHFYGRHLSERNYERVSVSHAKESIESLRGASSAQHNPFVILADKSTNEFTGECYGFNLVYSGNFLCEVSVDQTETTRIIMGINPTDFSWKLEVNEEFSTPEVVMVYSTEGFNNLSNKLHKLYIKHLCNQKWINTRRPILINNWEATYFNFNKEKLLTIARDAKDIGVEMLVMDDGWYGNRNDINSSLGDWYFNKEKLQGELHELVTEVNKIGLKFGIWFEPEMVSEKSDLYRKHPDWCLQAPGRVKTLSRNQYVLDMSRQDVRDYLYDAMEKILLTANIEYVKWDMNRNITEAWSLLLEPNRQGEIWHRYILGLYDLLERLQNRFPNILWEGCASGGGRFDPGMLYYFPQIWTSDNTDAIERTKIQCGTSYAYPITTMGAHVSAIPNHKTLRNTSLEVRGMVAMAGTFGFELDLSAASELEKAEMRRQVEYYKNNYDLINKGIYTRVENPYGNSNFSTWCFSNEESSEILLFSVQLRSVVNPPIKFVKLPMAKEDRIYVDVDTQVEYDGSILKNVGCHILMGEVISECQYIPDGSGVVKKFVAKM